ncbi:DUF871 domain-containing protein [Vagococcus salmoninarum]|uniref:DUF871 domain-containing protein n=1 Tax=Vagococcus salmoninarum TaxID=2739 RepID=UPI001FD4418F|nr:MupG family TIM beta-alpha barrel fold protein [Vagococcus salmoninarum]
MEKINGFSIFVGEVLSEKKKAYIKMMKEHGFKGVFTSLHIPEDDSSLYLERLISLGKLTKELDLTLMVDISAKALEAISIDIESRDDLLRLKEYGITGIRMDYGIEMALIAKVSRIMTVGLNASTLTEQEFAQLTKNNADFSQMELWHNYYPRENTGLAKTSFIATNQWLIGKGLKVVAFAPGDKKLRGPLYNHLPTLEKHRNLHPLACALELKQACYVEDVYIGDEELSQELALQFMTYELEMKLLFYVTIYSDTYKDLFIGCHTNRVDDARDVIRSQEARFKKLPQIQQENSIIRNCGAITLDNQLYGRYMGELQVAKQTLLADSRVNVVAQIKAKDEALIQFIKPGTKFEFRQ